LREQRGRQSKNNEPNFHSTLNRENVSQLMGCWQDVTACSKKRRPDS
jgi:hypothetical protein